MKILKILLCMLSAAATGAMAQTYQQKGVVRMITTSASSPITPVAGVKVAVGNSVSKPTSGNGAFTMQVTKQFQVNGVTPNDEYVLALPTKGKTYYQSQNDLDVVVTTKVQKAADYKKLYNQLKKKYRQQTRELDDMRQEYKDKLEELTENDAEYAKVKAQFDSLQTLYRDFVSNEDKIDEEIKKISDELSLTDYVSLDDIERRTYELKCAGEWKTLSDFLHDVMRGDAAAFLQEGIDIEKQKEEELKSAQMAKATRFRLVEEAIESFKMQYQNDSVSKYYDILTKADPTNWEYLHNAGAFELGVMANCDKAYDYQMRAMALNPCDTLQAASYGYIGGIYSTKGDYKQAIAYHQKALDIYTKYDECKENIAACYNCIGTAYSDMDDNENGIKYLKQALELLMQTKPQDGASIAKYHDNIAVMYMQMGQYEKSEEYLDKAIETHKNLAEKDELGLAACYFNKGSLYLHLGETDKVMDYFTKALKTYQTHYGEFHPTLATVYNSMGAVSSKAGKLDKALDYFQRALKIDIALQGEKSKKVALVYNNMALAYKRKGDLQQALDFYNKALAINTELFGETNIAVATNCSNIAQLYRAQKDLPKAIELFRKAHNIYTDKMGDKNKNTIAIKNNLYRCEYEYAVHTQDKQYLASHAIVNRNQKNGMAAQRKIADSCHILEYGNWSIDNETATTIFDEEKRLAGKKRSLLLYNGKEIIEESFEDNPGMDFLIVDIDKKEKEKLIETYLRRKGK